MHRNIGRILCCLFAIVLCASCRVGANEVSLQDVLDHALPPVWFDGIGTCNFTISTNSSQVQQLFNRGVLFLHSFWPFEAIRTFAKAISIEPNNAMAYWGLHRALSWDAGYATAAASARNRSRELTHQPGLTQRELLYIESSFKEANWTAYNETMQELFALAPADIDAKAFWAHRLISETRDTMMGNPKPGRIQAQRLLEAEAMKQPPHPGILHYLMHSYLDTPTPERALPAARAITDIAPANWHLQRACGQVYYLTNHLESAYDAFYQSWQANLRYNQNVSVIHDGTYIRTVALLATLQAQRGKIREAQQWGQMLQNLGIFYTTKAKPRPVIPMNPFNKTSSLIIYMEEGISALPFAYMSSGLWDRAAESLFFIVSFPDTVNHFPDIQGTTGYLLDIYRGFYQYCQGMNQLDLGNVNQAQQNHHQLQTILQRLAPSFTTLPKVGYRGYLALIVYEKELLGLLKAASGDFDAALDALELAQRLQDQAPYGLPSMNPRSVRHSHATVNMKMATTMIADAEKRKYYHLASTVCESILKIPLYSSNSLTIYRLGRIYEELGDTERAREYYANYLTATSSYNPSDDSLPQAQHAHMFLVAHSMQQQSNRPRSLLIQNIMLITMSIGFLLYGLGILGGSYIYYIHNKPRPEVVF